MGVGIDELGFTRGTFWGNYYLWYLPIVAAALALVVLLVVIMTSDRRPYGTAIRALAILSFLGTLPLGLQRMGIDFSADGKDMAVMSILGVVGAGIVSAFHFLVRGMMSRGTTSTDVSTNVGAEEMIETDATMVDDIEEISEEEITSLAGNATVVEDPVVGAEVEAGRTFATSSSDFEGGEQEPTSASSTPPPPAWLVFKSGTNTGQTIPIAGAVTTIGRAPENDVVVEDSAVSRQHAQIKFENGAFQLSDSGSSAGTLVEGHSAAETTALSSGSVVNVGETELVFMQSDSPNPSQQPVSESPAAAETMVGMPAQTEEQQKLMMWLAITSGPDKGGTCQLNIGETTIGRGEDCDLRIGDAAASRRHAVVIGNKEEVAILDLGSSSGTLVDGQTLSGRVLSSTSTVVVGDTELMLVDVEKSAPESPEPSLTADAAAATMVEDISNLADEVQAGILVVRKGSDAGKTFHLSEGDSMIGRDDCPVLLTDPTVSRRHAVIRKSGDTYTVFDLGSRTGTIVDSEKLSGAPLKGGSVISLGQSEIVVMDPSSV